MPRSPERLRKKNAYPGGMLISLRLTGLRGRVLTYVAALTFAALLVGLASPASAHSVLLGTDPDDGEQLAAAPEEISLTFNEDITDLGTEVVITAGDEERLDDGKTEISGPVVTQALAADRPEGIYTVTWRAVSADGHPISGEFTFTAAEAVGGETEAPPAEPEPDQSTEAGADEGAGDEPEEGDQATDDTGDDDDAASESSGLSPSTWVIIGVLILAAIILVTVLARGMSSRGRDD